MCRLVSSITLLLFSLSWTVLIAQGTSDTESEGATDLRKNCDSTGYYSTLALEAYCYNQEQMAYDHALKSIEMGAGCPEAAYAYIIAGIGQWHRDMDGALAVEQAQKAMEMAKGANDSLLYYRAEVLWQLGDIMRADWDRTVMTSAKTIRFLTAAEDTAFLKLAYYNSGLIALQAGLEDRYEDSYTGLELALAYHDTAMAIEFYSLIAKQQQYVKGDLQQASNFFNKIIALPQTEARFAAQMKAKADLMVLHQWLAHPDSAAYYQNQVLEGLAGERLNIHDQLELRTQMYNYFYDISDYDQASECVDSVIAARERVEMFGPLSVDYTMRGLILYQTGDIEVAEKSLLKAIDFARKYDCETCITTATWQLTQIYIQQGNTEKAMEMFALTTAFNDSLHQLNRQEALAIADEQFQTKLKDAELARKDAELKQSELLAEVQNSRIVLFVAISLITALLFVLMALAFLRNRRQKQKLEKLDQLNKQIFSIISHDFTGPLMSLKFLTEELEREEISTEEIKSFANDVNNQLAHTTQILDNLLTWAKSELSLNKIDYNANLTSIITEVSEGFSDRIKAKQITLEVSVPDGQQLAISPDLLRIVLRNLINNAIKYNIEGGLINVSYNPEKGEITVSDRGVGMSDEQQQKLFSAPVYAMNGTHEETGLGVGLYIAGQLLSRIHWSIRVDHSSEQGTTFAVKHP